MLCRTKTSSRQLRQELDRLLERRGLLPSPKPRRGLMAQNTLVPSRARLAGIQEVDIAATSSRLGPMQSLDYIEPESHWYDSDSTDSEFLNTYEDDSD